jgi:hypothetical protein
MTFCCEARRYVQFFLFFLFSVFRGRTFDIATVNEADVGTRKQKIDFEHYSSVAEIDRRRNILLSVLALTSCGLPHLVSAFSILTFQFSISAPGFASNTDLKQCI